MGLAAESLKGYFVQCSRWCGGGIQTLFILNGPIRGPDLARFSGSCSFRLAILLVPAVYFWTGNSTSDSFITNAGSARLFLPDAVDHPPRATSLIGHSANSDSNVGAR